VKFGFTDAETKACLLQGCADGMAFLNGPDQDQLKRRREEAKQQVKELKRRLQEEEEGQKALQETLKEAHQEAQGAYNACQREHEELAATQRDFSEFEGELTDTATMSEDTHGCMPLASGSKPEDVKKSFKMFDRVLSAKEEEGRKRRSLENEVARLEEQLKHHKAQIDTSRHMYDQEHKKSANLEKIHKTMLGFGLADITFDHARGVAVVGGAGSKSHAVDEALRTVSIQFDKAGKLVSAIPHDGLKLQDEAIDAVQSDDLPSLLTLVWQRTSCSQPTPVAPRHSPRGGA
jgi:DNA repair exonuclease SbcCD ATPase subunit